MGCPVNVPIRDFVRRVALRDFDGRRSRDPPAEPAARDLRPRLPGRAPVRGALRARSASRSRSAIGRLERFVADWQRAHGTGERVRGVRRAGATRRSRSSARARPGLTAASDLAQLGYPVTVFEALHAFGGVLRYGIPQYRLPKEIVDEDVEHLEALGVEFVRDVIIGKTVTIDQLRRRVRLLGRLRRHRRGLARSS